jgi:hypothetical protein
MAAALQRPWCIHQQGDGRMDNDRRATGVESQSGIIYTHQMIVFSTIDSVTVAKRVSGLFGIFASCLG